MNISDLIPSVARCLQNFMDVERHDSCERYIPLTLEDLDSRAKQNYLNDARFRRKVDAIVHAVYKQCEALRNKNEELQRQLDEAAKQEPVAWVRFRSDGGYEGPLMDSDSRMDGVRRVSGAWTKLYRYPPNLPALIEQARADAVNELHLNCVQVLALASERYDENVCTIVGAWNMAMSEIMELRRQLDRAAKQEPVSLDYIYAAWHGAGVDIAGGDWNGFVKMLAVAIRVRSGK